MVLQRTDSFKSRLMHVHPREYVLRQTPWRTRGLNWENKTNKLKRSINYHFEIFQVTKELKNTYYGQIFYQDAEYDNNAAFF